MWIAGQNEEIGVEKNQLETIKSENISTSNSLQAQLNDIKRYFQADLQRMEEEFRVQAAPAFGSASVVLFFAGFSTV